MLALLLEAGDAQTVVAAGEEWLATHRRDPRARDVALSTALAHRALADTLLKKQSDAVSAAAMLEVAADLLAQHRAAAGLQAEVAAALGEVQPALACQLVSAPLERFQERERGVEVRLASHLRAGGPCRRQRARSSCLGSALRLKMPTLPSMHSLPASWLPRECCCPNESAGGMSWPALRPQPTRRSAVTNSVAALAPSWQVAIEVLTDTSGTKKGMPKQAFLDRLAESLTAAEQVRLAPQLLPAKHDTCAQSCLLAAASLCVVPRLRCRAGMARAVLSPHSAALTACHLPRMPARCLAPRRSRCTRQQAAATPSCPLSCTTCPSPTSLRQRLAASRRCWTARWRRWRLPRLRRRPRLAR